MTITAITTFTTLSCSECGTPFALAKRFMSERREDHRTFWCPNGHKQYFPGKSDAELAQERADRAERRLESANRRAANADENARSAHASLVATKGHLTRAKKRAAHGICPCCSRTFANVARHVQSQHPQHVAEVSK